MTHFVDVARRIALLAHKGQVDKQGRDYFQHHLTPVAELLRPYGMQAEAAGWLHDLFEDTDIEPAYLAIAGIPEQVIDAVRACTRYQAPGASQPEPYTALIERCRQHPLGRIVKLAENWVNLSTLDDITDKRTRARLRLKYQSARHLLETF